MDISILEELGYRVLLSNQIIDALKFWRYDFIFAYFYRYAFFPALIAKMFGKNTYFTGGIDALDKNLVTKRDYIIQKWFFKFCYWVSKSCIIVSKTDDKNVRELVGGRKLSYSEHAIYTSELDCDIDKKENLITTIAWQATKGNVKRKGVDNALRLFANILRLQQYQNYTFYVIGKTGDGTMYLKQLVNELSIGDSVVFTDSVSEKEKINYLKRSKIYFQLSKFEGFGVAALEALCAKNIVVHSGKGGLSNPIYNEGILVNIEQPVDIMSVELKKSLILFDKSQLEIAHQNVCRDYDYKRRKTDFAKIIKEK